MVQQPRTETSFFSGLLVLIGGFVLLAVLVSVRPILTVDVQIERAVQSMRAPWLDAVAFGLSFLGFPPWSIVIDALIVLAIAITGQWWAAPSAGFGAAGSAALWFAVLAVVHRPRPTPDLVYVAARIGYGSFPSGHALNTLAFYGFLAVLAVQIERVWLRRIVVMVCALIPLGVG
ncbi:MAG: hypothetical protein JOY61_03525, partial [Chloroflexi bacterium]|nr:hypothetical protein [Chloroflexota bacterium]